jgi:transglutaminase/protease-like cytokinesis protein 3
LTFGQKINNEVELDINFTRVDNYVKNMPKYNSISQVAFYLNMIATNEWEKARAIYDWVCYNISYDTDAYFSNLHGNISAEDSFITGKSICSGYSKITLKLADYLDLQAIPISGYAKGYGYSEGQVFIDTNHEWNAFNIDGKWYLFDTTWGAGYIDDNRLFHREVTYTWFAMDPYLFLLTHYPKNIEKCLINTNITKEEFENNIFVYSYVFKILYENNISIKEQKELILGLGKLINENIFNIIELKNNNFTIEDIIILLKIYKNNINSKIWYIKELKSNKFDIKEIIDIINTNFTNEQFINNIYLKKYNFSNNDIYNYFIKKSFLNVYKIPVEIKVIDIPKEKILKIGKTYYFKIETHNTTNVAIICNNEFHLLKKDNNIYFGNVTITKGPVYVSFQKVGDKKYFTAFMYEAIK